MLSLTIGIAAGAACLGGVVAFVWHRRRGEDTLRHIARLAAGIVAVGGTIESDLETDPEAPAFMVFRQRCRENRERADQALEQGKALGQQEAEALLTTLLLLHDDHRRMVDLRSEVDRAVARRAAADRCVEIRFGHSSKPSRWPSSSPLTRPSTLG
ncbi:hypothetical protein GCM10028796_19590 [Ramlibacter monticola]|uniref:Uncharacterized protein n=1 Tax=Ramlibacter monticola TaxID=1926872 RepID=A0A936Z1Z6_9BURK|nr:hypothetical protein [Ramlibacter monticola]MBL0392215.1 hypothetical protein [Ramlibacter monticola]